jgi:ABC-type phosphate transport system substrate-binding protein
VNRPRGRATRAVVATGVLAGTLVGVIGISTTPAGAQTDPTALIGEGGSFLSPVTNLLLNTDTGLAPLNPQYSDTDLDSGIADFVGSGPGEFDADFAVSERPLTGAEAQTAATNGRSFAYVPFAATPVAIAVFAICDPTSLTTNTITSSTFCQNMPLTPALVGEIFTHGLSDPSDTGLTTLSGWNDPQLTQADGAPIPDPNGIGLATNLSASAENSALMALMDSDQTAKADLDNALNNAANTPRTTSDTPDELWPFILKHSYVGGDEGLLGKELTIEATSNAPSFLDSWGALGPVDGGAHDAFPVSAVWTGSPEGTPWNVPTAAIENADSKFVGPTESAAVAAESGSGMTLDPTNNLVTFNPDPTDSGAYNNYLMAESYLVVPTSGLAAAKAIKLAQFIRYVLGPTGQSEIAILGAAPATAAEVTAGLKVASELDAEASVATASGSGSTGASSQSSSAGLVSAGQSASSSDGSGLSGDPATTGSASAPDGPTLASTGLDPLPVLVAGSTLLVVAGMGRRRLRRRTRA